MTSALLPGHRLALTIVRRQIEDGREDDLGINTVSAVVDGIGYLEALIDILTTERDLARDVAVALEQEVAVLTAERDGEIDRLQQARQDAYDSYTAALAENMGLRQQVEHLSTSWGFVSGGES